MSPNAHPGSACLEMPIDPQVLLLFDFCFSDQFTSFIIYYLRGRNELCRTTNIGVTMLPVGLLV